MSSGYRTNVKDSTFKNAYRKGSPNGPIRLKSWNQMQ